MPITKMRMSKMNFKTRLAKLEQIVERPSRPMPNAREVDLILADDPACALMRAIMAKATALGIQLDFRRVQTAELRSITLDLLRRDFSFRGEQLVAADEAGTPAPAPVLANEDALCQRLAAAAEAMLQLFELPPLPAGGRPTARWACELLNGPGVMLPHHTHKVDPNHPRVLFCDLFVALQHRVQGLQGRIEWTSLDQQQAEAALEAAGRIEFTSRD